MSTGDTILMWLLLGALWFMFACIFSPLFVVMMGYDVVEEEESKPPVVTEYKIDVEWWKEWEEVE